MSLSDLMRMAPMSGAFLTGQQHSSNMQNDAMRRMELADLMNTRQQELSMKRELHPLEMQRKQADLKGLMEQDRERKLKNDFTEATQQGQIDFNNFKSTNDVYKALAEEFGTLGAQMESVPEMDRGRFFVDSLRKRGISERVATDIAGRFSHVPSADLGKALTQYHKLMLENSPTFQQKKMLQQELEAGKTERAAEAERGRMERHAEALANRELLARIVANSKNKPELSLEQQVYADMKGKDASTRLAVLFQGIERAKEMGNIPLAQKLLQQAKIIAPLAQAKNDPREGTTDLRAASKGRLPVHEERPIQFPDVPGAEPPAAAPKPKQPASATGPFTDAEKERRYQEWKKKQQG